MNKLASTEQKDAYKNTTIGFATEGYVHNNTELANLYTRKDSGLFHSAEQQKKYHNKVYKKPSVVLVNGNFFWRKTDDRRQEEKQKVTNEKQEEQLKKLNKIKEKGLQIIEEDQEILSKRSDNEDNN